jgi:hypothetical protein
MIRASLFSLALFATAGSATAQTSEPCRAPERRALDFWVGRWDVRDEKTGAAVGENRIAPIWGGCGILETFASADGFQGGSVSQWDAEKKVWRLTGGGSTGAAMVFEGGFEGARLVLTSEIKGADGKPRRLRMILEPAADGGARQSSDVSSDGGQTWRPRYAYTYRRLAG